MKSVTVPVSKILIAHRDPDVCRSLAGEFSQNKIRARIKTIQDGGELAERQPGDRSDVVLLDLSIRRLEVVTKRLESDGRKRRLFVVSPCAREREKRIAARLNADYFGVEPVPVHVMFDRMKTMLKDSGAARKNPRCLDGHAGEELQLLFDFLGTSENLKGCCYLCEAMRRIRQDPSLLLNLSSRLYPDIARDMDDTGVNVERNIRYASALIWNRMTRERRARLFPDYASRPGTKLFLSLLLRLLSEQKNMRPTSEKLLTPDFSDQKQRRDV